MTGGLTRFPFGDGEMDYWSFCSSVDVEASAAGFTGISPYSVYSEFPMLFWLTLGGTFTQWALNAIRHSLHSLCPLV